MWFLGLDEVYREVHHTARVEILAITVREFVTDYLAENGRWIVIIRELSVNDSVQFLGFSDQARGSGFAYIANLLDQNEAIGWVSSSNSNHIWRGRFNDANRIINAVSGDPINASPTNFPQRPGRPLTT